MVSKGSHGDYHLTTTHMRSIRERLFNDGHKHCLLRLTEDSHGYTIEEKLLMPEEQVKRAEFFPKNDPAKPNPEAAAWNRFEEIAELLEV